MFVGGDASRTGAPIALLRIARELTERQAIVPIFLLREAGELLGEFQELGRVEMVPARRDHTMPALLRKVLPSGREELAVAAYWSALGAQLRRRLTSWGADVIYANTCHHGRLLASVKRSGLPIVCHIHEMDRHVRRNVSEADMSRLVRAVDWWVTPSAAAAAQLRSRGVPSELITLAPGPVPAASHQLDNCDRRRIRSGSYGAGEDAFAVIGCGSPSWTKGTDLFVDMAMVLTRAAAERGLDVRVAWLGADHTYDTLMMREDIELAGLTERVRLVESVPDASDHLAAADIIVSTSREDTMPLVLLEAAMVRRPVVCFANSGGATEIVEAGGGVSVDYLDVAAMSDAILDLLSDPARAAALGEAAHRFASARSTPQAVGDTVLAVLEKALSSHQEN